MCTLERGNNDLTLERGNNYLYTKTFNEFNGHQNVKSNLVTLEREA